MIIGRIFIYITLLRLFAEGLISSNGIDIEEEFKMFKQVGGVEEFTEKYDELRALMLVAHPYLTKSYFLKTYISCLKTVVMCYVKIGRLDTLLEVYILASQAF